MTRESINRRDVLKSVSVGAATVVGTGRAVATEKTGYGPVRLVEVAIRYELSEDLRYSGAVLTGDPTYYLTDESEVVITAPQEKFERVFENNDRVVGSARVDGVPTTVTGTGQVGTLVTDLRGRRLPAERIRLAEPYTPPTVSVRETPSGVAATVGDERVELSPGTRQTITLPPETVTARTFRTVDDAPSIEGIPDHRIGPRTEFDEAKVEATPEVLITDRGEVSVARVKPSDRSKN